MPTWAKPKLTPIITTPTKTKFQVGAKTKKLIPTATNNVPIEPAMAPLILSTKYVAIKTPMIPLKPVRAKMRPPISKSREYLSM